MRIALVHDYIKEYGGAERVLEALHEMYPNAPVFTLVYCPEFLGPHRKRFENWNIKTSPLNDIPFKEKFISMYRLIAPWAFQLFNFAGYDVIIVSATGAYSPNTIRKKSAQQICYCHTPPRYLYGYATAREWKKHPLVRVVAEWANTWLRKVDKNASKHVDVFIANSEEVKARIKKFYQRDAVVVYPPVEDSSLSFLRKQESRKGTGSRIKSGMTDDYYLAGGRLARPKHFDLIIRTANEQQLPLKIFGKGFAGYGEELRAMAGPTVEFLGEVTDEEKREYMEHAKAFIMASEDEDFGITPVEAMGVGTPVIAYKSGGLKETVVDGKTGIFFDELSVAGIVGALKKLEALRLRSGKKLAEDCVKRAEQFDTKHFVDGIQKVLAAFS